MHDIGPVGRVTSSSGNVDREGEVVGALLERVREARLELATAVDLTRARSPFAAAAANVALSLAKLNLAAAHEAAQTLERSVVA